MINFKQTNHSSRIAKAVEETENDDNLVISGSDGVPININNLWLFSPLVRSILASLTKAEQHLIILPGISSEDIRNGLAILNGPDPDNELIFFIASTWARHGVRERKWRGGSGEKMFFFVFSFTIFFSREEVVRVKFVI